MFVNSLVEMMWLQHWPSSLSEGVKTVDLKIFYIAALNVK